MKESRPRRPSPALLISLLALFVALGGSAYAANQLAKNSVGSKQLKSNAVTAAKIKKNAVTTAKVKDNAITGAKINEGSLGPVPNANNANNATNAANAANFSRFFTSGLKKASIGQTVPLLTVGPFTITGKCSDKGGGLIQARQWLTTTQVGSSMYSAGDTSNYEANFNPGEEIEIGLDTYNNNPYVGWEDAGDAYTGFHAASADGATLLEGDAVSGVLVYGAQCVFWVSATNVG